MTLQQLPYTAIIERWSDGEFTWKSKNHRDLDVYGNADCITVDVKGFGKGQMKITTFPEPYGWLQMTDNVVSVLIIGMEEEEDYPNE